MPAKVYRISALPVFVVGLVALHDACNRNRVVGPRSMQLIVLDNRTTTLGGKWDELVGRPLVAVEYDGGSAAGGSSLYLYDGVSGANDYSCPDCPRRLDADRVGTLPIASMRGSRSSRE
jgi:hypothetical protein